MGDAVLDTPVALATPTDMRMTMKNATTKKTVESVQEFTSAPTVPPSSGVQSTEQRRIAELEEQVAKFKGHRDALIAAARERFDEMTLQEHRDRAIGAVGNLVQKMAETGRPATEWQAVFDMLLAAVGAAPSQVST